jgi:prepilin-type N-terminal cleavage/methylation domain-containing protein
MRKTRKFCSDPRGFTMVELVVVITIIGIVLVMILPGFGARQQQARVRAGANEIAQDFRQIRERALSLGRGYQVTSPNPRQYLVTDPDGNVKLYNLGQATGGNLQFGTSGAVGAPPEDNDGAPDGFDFPMGALNFLSRGGASRGVAYITDGVQDYAVGVNSLGKVRVYHYDAGAWN